jgi:hypothetical protein
VLGGHLYVDSDGSRSYSQGDDPASGGAVVDRLENGSPVAGYGALVDATGFWEVRALPDGVYRVMWEPSPRLPEDQWPLTIPPMETINLEPQDTVHNNTVHVITRTVEIKGANRILDIDFGIPPQPPALGSGGEPQLPSTGTGSGGVANVVVLYIVVGGALTLALGGLLWQRRHRVS